MGPRGTPALIPVILLLAGVRLGLDLGRPSIPMAAGLVALGAALGSRTGLVVVSVAVGLLTGGLERQGAPVLPAGFQDPERPVVVTLRAVGAWHDDGIARWARVRARLVRQGRDVVLWNQSLIVTVAGEGALPVGTGMRARGYLRRSVRPANGRDRAPGGWRLRIKNPRFVAREPPGRHGLAGRFASPIRRRVGDALSRLPGEGAGRALALALVLGDRESIPPAWKRGLRRTGLSHLLAISGLHVALLGSLLLLPGAWLPRSGRLLLVLLSVSAYLVLAGPRPSLVRATVMSLLAWHGFWVGRPSESLNTLACAAGGMVLLEPGLLDDLGFRLTVSATAGIVVLGSRFETRWRSALPEPFVRPLAASLGAQLATLPWTVPVFGLLTPLAPFWNLVAVPWTAACLLASLGVTFAALVHPALASGLTPLLDLMAEPFGLPGWLEPGPWRPGILGLGSLGSWSMTLLVVWLLLGSTTKRFVALPALFALLAGPVGEPVASVTMIDVGQGDAILLRDGEETLLVDGGGWSRGDLGGRVLVPFLASRGVRRLSAVALSHPDRDHCAGLVDLASYLEIGEIWMAPGWGASDCVHRLLSMPGPGHRFLWAGERVEVGRWRFTAVHPPAGDRSGRNDRSLALLGELEGYRVLLTGDLESEGESRMVARLGTGLGPVDLLKIAHHGSAGSTSTRFLSATRPRLALISAGRRNRYGHPSPIILERLSRRAIPVLRTDRDGLVRVDLIGGGRFAVSLPGSPR